jgi:hypothetical protein
MLMSTGTHSERVPRGAVYSFSPGGVVSLVSAAVVAADSFAAVPSVEGGASANGGVSVVAGAVELEAAGPVWPTGGEPSGADAGGGAAGLTALNASPLCFAQNHAAKQITIQIEAVMIVIRVKTSPALAPKALDPPMPPSAPARPPPRPRCTSTSNIKKIANRDKTIVKNASAMGGKVSGVRVQVSERRR